MLHVLENEFHCANDLEVLRSCTSSRKRDHHYLNFGYVRPFPCFFCFTWEFGNMSPKNNCPRNSCNCFRKKQITKFHCKIGNQLFNKFSIVPLVSFLLLFTSKNLTKKRLPWMSSLKFSTFSEKHEANKNKYGLTKELFSTRMTKTTHACSAV